MQVYEQLTGMQTVINFDTVELEPFDVEGSVQDVVVRLSTHVAGGSVNPYFALITNGMTMVAQNAPGANGLPMITGNINREIRSGDIVFLRDATGPAEPGRLRATIRIYNTGGTDLFMALNEDPAFITLASAVSGMQFFIRSDTGESTTTPHRMNIGYQLTCDPATPIMETDGLSCREIESAADCPGEFFNNAVSPARCDPIPNCGTGTTGTANAQNECECATEGDVFVSGSNMQMCETPTATPTDANCGANAINDPNDNTMCVCENTETHEFVDGSTTICELISEDNMEETEMENEMEESQNQQTQPQNNGSGRPKEFAYIGAGVFIIGFAASYIAGGGFPIFTYSPDFGYSITENGYAANIGGRADFRKDNWHLYYSANQTNANGDFADFRYTSGGRYNGDLFVATFSESVAGETANYNFSLSADVDGRLVDFSPVYRLHSEYDKGEFSTRNELNLQSNFHYDGWTINPSAGFRWENANDFSKNARFQINAIHRF